jgi:hypothetical protein
LAFYFHILTTMHGQNHIKTVTSVYVTEYLQKRVRVLHWWFMFGSFTDLIEVNA